MKLLTFPTIRPSVWPPLPHCFFYIPEQSEDEDSGEEIFSAPSTSGTSQTRNKAKQEKKSSFDNISTDFKSILDASNDK